MLTHVEFVKRFNEKWNGEYSLIGTYIKSEVPILFKHNKCGRVYEKFPHEALRYGCKECAKLIKQMNLLDGGLTKTQEQFTKELKEKFGDEYAVVGRYEHYKKKIKLHHSVCDHDFYLRPTDILYDNRTCTYCSQSRGAKIVEDYLLKNGITYEREFAFKDCKHERKLHFDFAVFMNESLNCLIEYDGGLHYTKVKHFGGINKLEYIQKLDRIKDKYCSGNGIKLIRIPYHIKDICKYLDEILMNNAADQYKKVLSGR